MTIYEGSILTCVMRRIVFTNIWWKMAAGSSMWAMSCLRSMPAVPV